MSDVDAITAVSPYLGYPDGDAAASWLVRVLGFRDPRCSRDEHGAWYEGELVAGASTLHLGGGAPAEGGQGRGAALIVHVPDVDAAHRRAVAEGADAAPPRDAPYGPRVCEVVDPWGYRWFLWEGRARY